MSKNNGFSAIIALLLTLVAIAVGQIFKEQLSATRQGTLLAGGLGSLIFTFVLTALSNFKMSAGGPQTKSGLGDAAFSLFIAVCASASIHRVAITICILFSGIFLFFLNGISQTRYSPNSVSGLTNSSGQIVGEKKKK